MTSVVVKRLFDMFVSFIGIVLFLPILLTLAILITIDSRGGIFFVQDRLGLNGSIFKMYKFRTMIKNAEKQGTGLFSYQQDPRVTTIGKWLRLTSLDELPQLFNVLKGDMSVVGPRPPVTYELGNYADFSPELKRRFVVKPGITGLAQVSGRNDLTWDEKVVFDNRYIEVFRQWGIFFDLCILAKTVSVVLSMRSVIEKQNAT